MAMEFVPPPYSDRCPDACPYNWDEAETPTAVMLGGGGYLANYQCSRCDLEWACCWSIGGYGEIGDRYMGGLIRATIADGVTMLPPGGRRYPQPQAKSA